MITIIKDIDIIYHVSEYDAILVSANLYGTMSGGFQYDVRQNYPYVHLANINTKYGDTTKLGTILEVSEKNKPTFCLCYIYDQINTRPDLSTEFLNYESLEKCLQFVNILYKGKRIASTVLGCSKFDGNGNKDVVIKLFEQYLTDVDLTLYDFKETSRRDKWVEAYVKGKQIGKEQGQEEYKKFIKESKIKFAKKINYEDKTKSYTRPYKVNTIHSNKKRKG